MKRLKKIAKYLHKLLVKHKNRDQEENEKVEKGSSKLNRRAPVDDLDLQVRSRQFNREKPSSTNNKE